MATDRTRKETRPLVKSRNGATESRACVPAGAEPRFYTLSEVQNRIRHYLEPALSAAPFWVMAELSDVSCRDHLYCTLVESNGGHQVAKLRCQIWSRELLAMKRRYAEYDLVFDPQNGTRVGLLCKVAFHDVHGLSLNAIDIDPNITLGELERRRREILRRLADANLLEKNSGRPVPRLPQRIGLIAARESASQSDFLRTLQESPYGFSVWVAEAQVQGRETETSMIRALRRLEALQLDLIVLIRGGGSRIELGYLDNEAIARAVAHCRLPVWTGIGHETDRSVLDEVAAKAFRTPTAVAEELVHRFKVVDLFLSESRSKLRKACHIHVVPQRRRLEGLAGFLRRASLGAVAQQKQIQQGWKRQFSSSAFNILRHWGQRLEGWRRELQTQPFRTTAIRRVGLGANADRLRRAADQTLRAERELLGHRRVKLEPARLQRRLASYASQVRQLAKRLRSSSSSRSGAAAGELRLARRRFRLERFLKILDDCRGGIRSLSLLIKSADPQNVLKRGYALVHDENGRALLGIDDVAAGQVVTVRMRDGEFEAAAKGRKVYE